MDNTSKIKFILIKLERALVFQVLEQEKCKCVNFTVKTIHGDINIGVSSYPELKIGESNFVYIRGHEYNRDLDITVEKFKSNTERDLIYNKIIEGLKIWSTML